jgi:hypothetical protein
LEKWLISQQKTENIAICKKMYLCHWLVHILGWSTKISFLPSVEIIQ